MTRYLMQPCETSCGPTLAVNALKWAGVKATREKTLPKSKKGMKWKPANDGCYNTHILDTIRKMGKGKFILKRETSTPAVVMNHILNGGAAYLQHYAHDRIQHVSLAIEGVGYWLPFTIVNAHLVKGGSTKHSLTKRSFKRLLKRQTTFAYLISKA